MQILNIQSFSVFAPFIRLPNWLLSRLPWSPLPHTFMQGRWCTPWLHTWMQWPVLQWILMGSTSSQEVSQHVRERERERVSRLSFGGHYLSEGDLPFMEWRGMGRNVRWALLILWRVWLVFVYWVMSLMCSVWYRHWLVLSIKVTIPWKFANMLWANKDNTHNKMYCELKILQSFLHPNSHLNRSHEHIK